MSDQPEDSPQTRLRQDEIEKLANCRRSAIIVGSGSAGLAYLVTRYLITMTPLQNSFLARNRGLTYAIVVGYSLYRGILSTGKKCMVGLATLEDSRYGEFARRALQMKEDKKNLTRAEFIQKYPPGEQRKLLDPSTAFTTRPSRDTSSPRHAPQELNPQPDMFSEAQQPDPPRGPKSFHDLQKENRSRNEHTLYPHHEQSNPKQQPNYNKPSLRPDALNNLPPGPEGKSKVKRNKYGDVVYED